MKDYFKKFHNILKPILIFIAVFVITFIILLLALVIRTYAAEPDTTQAADELTTETETLSISDAELSSINDEIESLLNETSYSTDDTEDGEESLSDASDSEADKDKSDKTIIIYQVPAQTQAAFETEPVSQVNSYNSLDEYLESESPSLTYSEFLIVKELKAQNIMLAFILGLCFITMISSWRRKR